MKIGHMTGIFVVMKYSLLPIYSNWGGREKEGMLLYCPFFRLFLVFHCLLTSSISFYKKKSWAPAAAASVTVRSIAFLKYVTDRLGLKCHQDCILSLREVIYFEYSSSGRRILFRCTANFQCNYI